MRKQMFVRVTVFGFLLALAAASVHAQSGTKIAARMPFDFTVGGTKLRAGEYTVTALSSSSDVLTIRSMDAKSAVMRLAGPIYASRPSVETRLVFHRYGERYFLSEVWTAGETTGRRLFKSSQERAIEKELRNASKREAQAGYERVEIIGTLQ